MKKIILFAALALTGFINKAQTNVFPTSGYVGIGTTAPLHNLHVVGRAQLGNIYFNGGTHIAFTHSTGHGVINFGNNGLGNLYFRSTPQAGNISTWSELMILTNSGSLGIGTTNPGIYKLAVNGAIRAKSIKVESGWADYVFQAKYELMPLSDLRDFIVANKKLPKMPSEKEVAADGLDLGETQVLLLEKIEELTLYILQLEERLELLEK